VIVDFIEFEFEAALGRLFVWAFLAAGRIISKSLREKVP
jgi:hypothetical protein